MPSWFLQICHELKNVGLCDWVNPGEEEYVQRNEMNHLVLMYILTGDINLLALRLKDRDVY